MMGRHKKVMCKVCYREMRSDVLARHMKQHSKRNESNPVTNISVTKNYNTTSSVLADREDEVECEPQTTIDEKALEIAALKINKEYEEKVASSTNEELIEAIEVWKIYKLLQQMKNK